MMEIQMHYPENDQLFLKNPGSSELGHKIINKSIYHIKELGLEGFTFKKLASEIGSNEASIYRYFENKHNLLVYLISIYWEILDFKIIFNVQNISSPKTKLKKMIEVLTDIENSSPKIKNLDVNALHSIVVEESAKAYLTKKVEVELQKGFFESYEKLINTIAGLFIEASKKYEFPRALAINLLETTFEQFYFSQHLGSWTELKGKNLSSKDVKRFLESLIFSVLNLKDKD
ncbi:TetR/AcrR family transcriptional regulator [Negadavirga shengliensis]|uniref:TetR/AcrR family transcriptional regulator n=1 Tax=Negadavirga shengliensis TaxID=1389218 RepID=A0ABV9T5D2_9BACT